jgi:hypothetical protein
LSSLEKVVRVTSRTPTKEIKGDLGAFSQVNLPLLFFSPDGARSLERTGERFQA